MDNLQKVSTGRELRERLLSFITRAIRAIGGSRKYDHVTSSYKFFMILKIHDLCKLEITTLMHKYDKLKLPSAFDGQLENHQIFIVI